MKCKQMCQLKNKCCKNKECRYWIDYDDDLNCTFIAIEKHGKMTLREIAEREGLTFARIQQIEKQALKKLSKRSDDLKDFLFS
tara:strand:+ start:512 stop:760 length:249 start_codon:yes stop_codon:yes gene_type:complete